MFELVLLLLAANPGHADFGHAKAGEAYEEELDRAAGLEHRANELVAASAAEPAAAAAATAPWTEAEAAYRAAIRVDPADPRAYYHLGHMLRAAGPARTSETIELFEVAAALDPLSPSLASSLGYLLLATTGIDSAARQRRLRGAAVLGRGVTNGIWPKGIEWWQHPMEWLPAVPPPPPPSVLRQRPGPFECLLGPIEAAAAQMAHEARSLLPRYAVQVEGLSRPHGGWRDYELWRRCGLGGFRPSKSGNSIHDSSNSRRVSLLPPPPPELAETCAVLRGVAASSGALVHSAMFSAIAPDTRLEPHCGPNNGRLVLHAGLSTPHPEAARLRLGRPTSLDDVTEDELRDLGLPTAPPQEVPWREGEGFVWDDSTCHEVLWRAQNRTAGPGTRPPDEDAVHLDLQGQCDGGANGVGACGDDAGARGRNRHRYTVNTGTDSFVRSKPRIILLLLFFHPQMTRAPVC